MSEQVSTSTSSDKFTDRLKQLGEWLRDFIFIAPKPIRHVIIFEVLWLYLIFGTGQGSELITLSFEDYLSNGPLGRVGYLLLVYVAYIFLSFIIYAQCQDMYILYRKKKNLETKYNVVRIRFMEELHALVWAVLPLMIMLVTYLGKISEYGVLQPVIHVLVLAFCIVGLISTYLRPLRKMLQEARKRTDIKELNEEVISKRRSVVQMERRSVKRPDSYQDTKQKLHDQHQKLIEKVDDLGFKEKKTKNLYSVMYMYVFIVAGIYLFFPQNNFLNRPMVVSFTGLSMLSILVTSLSKWRKNSNIPVFFLTLLWLVFWSYFNNNHTIRHEEGGFVNQEKAVDHFNDWLSFKMQQDYFFKNDTARIYIIAAEGGGIRSAYWTGGALAKLQETHPDLIRRTYAMSGVSGGSLGLATFNTYYRDHCLPGHEIVNRDTINEIHSKDFLSPLLAGLLFPDMLQRFLPWPIPILDRARRLENGWSYAYEKATGKHTPDISLYDLYNEENRFELPNLFFNTTRVETGNKAIISNLRLDTLNFVEAIDVGAVTQEAHLLKSVTFASARFPYVTPVAKIYSSEGEGDQARRKKWGHIVDGGYFDNTGLHTALEILDMIEDRTDTMQLDSNRVIKPTILFFQNSQGEEDSQVPAMNGLYESTPPLITFYNSWLSRANYFTYDIKTLAEEMDFEYLVFRLPDRLDNEVIKFPLGWTLSQRTREKMDSLIARIPADKWNGENFTRLASWEER